MRSDRSLNELLADLADEVGAPATPRRGNFSRFGRNANTWPTRQTRAESFATLAAGDPSKWTTLAQEPIRSYRQTDAFLALHLSEDPLYYGFLKQRGIPSESAGDREVIAQYLCAVANAMDRACKQVDEYEAIIAAGRCRWIIDSPDLQQAELDKIRERRKALLWCIGGSLYS
jgi:hypothetical protein